MPSKELAAQEISAELRTAPRGASLGIRVSVTAIAIILACIDSAAAQDWPTRPIRLVVGASAGELITIWALAITQRLNIRALTGVVVPYVCTTGSSVCGQ